MTSTSERTGETAAGKSREQLRPESSPLLDATCRLLEYCKSAQWAGYDPYDGLNSRLFKALPFLHSRWPRLILIQSFKRSPVNLRKLFAVTPEVNPKGMALFVSSMVRLHGCGLASRDEVRQLADHLVRLRTPGWKNACWGYHFDWQTRGYLVPRGYPNIICTTFAGEALLDAYDLLGDSTYLELATSAARFLLDDLKRTSGEQDFCFSYTPLCESRVHNASLLGAALLARLHSITPSTEYRDAAEAATRYGIRHQQPDGSWIYGEDEKQTWIDSFHTGYNLLALRSVESHLQTPGAAESLRRGFAYYRDHFFEENGVVKYFHNRTYPIDSHAVAHAILTLTQLADLDPANLALAEKVVGWSVAHMQNRAGYFHYQKRPWFTNRISYMRWTQAWMLRGMAELLLARSRDTSSSGRPVPRESKLQNGAIPAPSRT